MLMPYRFLSIFIFCFGLLGAQQPEIITIRLNPHLVFEHYEHYKRLVMSSPDGDLDHIDGFEFEWGYVYELKVKRQRLNPSLTDGTRYRYQLLKLISKSKVPDSTRFSLYLDAQRYYHHLDSSEAEMNQSFHQINDSTYRYLDQVNIEVPEALGSAWQNILKGRSPQVGRFRYCPEDENCIRLEGF